MSLFVCITTIQSPTSCMVQLSKKIEGIGTLVVAGDTKGPPSYELPHAIFLDIEAQEKSGFRLAELLPTRHYARKNIAYLTSIREGATCIYETDDDNRPSDSWYQRSETIKVTTVDPSFGGWVNVYKHFTDEFIWPRGLPLDQILNGPPSLTESSILQCPIQQGLVNNSADVDAIWRLLMDRPFYFNPEKTASVYLGPGQWCPFNTQSTWWWPLAYPLLYVPSYCSFRMCDIWKSFVAQRCLWALDLGIAFHPPEVIQDRNEHDLNHDFADEVPGYLSNHKIAEILSSLKLESGQDAVAANLTYCYQALVEKEIFPEKEMDLVTRWCEDVSSCIA